MAEKRIKRTKKQVILDLIHKNYAKCESFAKNIKRIESMLNAMQAEYEAELKKSASIKRISAGKSKEQIQALIDGLQEQIKTM